MNANAYNPFTTAQEQFDAAAETLGLVSGLRELLRFPLREHAFSIPVKMDDGSVKVFRGFRVLHSDARGPAKGGIRFHPQETIDTVRALSMWMTWKTAAVDIPLGGGKGGVICDPHSLSLREQELLCRGYVRQIAKDIGPHVDVPAPDVMTSAQHMLWMLDEYEVMMGQKTPGLITGKPVGMGGSLGRKEATGYGVVYTIREALKELGLDPAKTSASVQGFGNVAQFAIELYNQMGGSVKCVSSWDQTDSTSYSFAKNSGVDLKQLRSITDQFGGIDKNKAKDAGYEVKPGNAWLEAEVDILIPAALENQITSDNVESINQSVKVIAEGANGPTTPAADEVLSKRGVFVVPDFLANAGGVTCSYFEQVQCNMNYFWERDEVISKLDLKMTAAFHSVANLARKKKMFTRDAAYLISVDRVAQACRDRGWV